MVHGLVGKPAGRPTFSGFFELKIGVVDEPSFFDRSRTFLVCQVEVPTEAHQSVSGDRIRNICEPVIFSIVSAFCI
jgi:hypothetical protein